MSNFTTSHAAPNHDLQKMLHCQIQALWLEFFSRKPTHICVGLIANRHCCWAGSNLALLPPLMQEFKRFQFAVGQRHAAMCSNMEWKKICFNFNVPWCRKVALYQLHHTQIVCRIKKIFLCCHKPQATAVANSVISQIENVWKKASIPIVSHQKVMEKLKLYHDKHRSLLRPYRGRQHNAKDKGKIEDFRVHSLS